MRMRAFDMLAAHPILSGEARKRIHQFLYSQHPIMLLSPSPKRQIFSLRSAISLLSLFNLQACEKCQKAWGPRWILLVANFAGPPLRTFVDHTAIPFHHGIFTHYSLHG